MQLRLKLQSFLSGANSLNASVFLFFSFFFFLQMKSYSLSTPSSKTFNLDLMLRLSFKL